MDPLADRRARLSQTLRDTGEGFKRRWAHPPATLWDMEAAKADLVRATELLTDLYCVFACDLLGDKAPPMLREIETARRLMKKRGIEERHGMVQLPPMVAVVRAVVRQYGAVVTGADLHNYIEGVTVLLEMGAAVIINEAETELEFEL